MRRSNTAASAARRLAAGLGAAVALGLAAAPAQAATVPAWDLSVAAVPTHLAPGETGKLAVRAFDVGSAAPDGSPITLTVRLPAGVTFTGPVAGCSAVDQLVTCTPTVAGGGYGTDVFTAPTLLPVAVDAGMAVGDADVTATVSGGGAVGTETLTQPVRIDPQPARFGVDSFHAEVFDEEGDEETRAGVHPWAAVTDFTFNAVQDPVYGRAPADNVQDIDVDMPAGFAGNAALMPRCSSADFNAGSPGGSAAAIGCPADTRVGSALVAITLAGTDSSDQFSGVFNMTPPRGYAAMFAFRAVQANVTVLVKLREDGDYGLTASLRDVTNSVGVVSSRLTLWGVPGDLRRNPSATTQIPYLSNPFDCSAGPLETGLSVSSWQDPGRSAHTEDVAPALTGCDQLDFRPSIAVTPETTKSDSATGLSVDLGIAQEITPGRTMAAPLKDAVVTLPQGVSINPSVAGGLQACSDEQFGLKTLGRRTARRRRGSARSRSTRRCSGIS